MAGGGDRPIGMSYEDSTRVARVPQGGRSAFAALSACAAVTVLWAGACSSARAVAPVASSAAIWFHPLSRIPAPPAISSWADSVGSTDYLSLFVAGAPWPRAMAHTAIIGLYAGWVASASDQDFQQVVGFLNAHGMGIELESP